MTDLTQIEMVNVRVVRALPFGLLVRLEDGREGVIREREIAWNPYERQRWRSRFKVGDMLRAVLLGERIEQRLELSLRLAENDPWLHLVERYPLGLRVDGMVTAIQPYGVFVELEPGITGLLHASRLPHKVQAVPMHDVFWVGDAVRVTIERIDTVHRQIGLSLVRALVRRWDIDWGIAPSHVDLPRDPPHVLVHPASDADEHPIWRIVIIEDDTVHRDALVRWLQRAGHQVRSVATAEEGLALVAADPPDLLLSDWGLPNMSGAEGIMWVRRRWPGVRCALMTDWTRTSESTVAFEQLREQAVPILIKPLRPDDLHALLLEHADMHPDEATDLLAADLAEPTLLDRLPEPLPTRERIELLLERQRRRTGATKVVLFVFDPVRRKVEILAEAGGAPLNREALSDLIYSPVRDVAEDRRLFRLNEVHEADQRVRYLRPLLNFHACVGLPLPVQLADRYALFAFSAAHKRDLSQHLEEYSAATALALATLLERDSFRAHALDTQRLALLGQLSRALVHEVNHRLSPVNFALSEIGQIIGSMELPSRPAQLVERDLRQLRAAFDDLSLGINRLTETARMFGRMMVQSREQVVPLRDVLHETIELVTDMAERSHVRIALLHDDTLPAIQVPAIQLQQMLLNVVINAIQQISLSTRNQGGHVVLRTCPWHAEGKAYIRIEVEDDGPGLHRELWERVFELGFTTRRKEGSGLGLYITRSLAEALGARVLITKSFLLWGTTFVIEIPVT